MLLHKLVVVSTRRRKVLTSRYRRGSLHSHNVRICRAGCKHAPYESPWPVEWYRPMGTETFRKSYRSETEGYPCFDCLRWLERFWVRQVQPVGWWSGGKETFYRSCHSVHRKVWLWRTGSGLGVSQVLAGMIVHHLYSYYGENKSSESTSRETYEKTWNDFEFVFSWFFLSGRLHQGSRYG